MIRVPVAVGAGLVAVILSGCTHRQQLSADGAKLERGDRVAAMTTEGAAVDGTIVTGPLGGYRLRTTGRELELAELKEIRRESRGRGAIDGLLIGAAAGAVFGTVLAIATWDEDDPGFVGPESKEGVIMLSGAAWAAIGGLVGAAGGAAAGATYAYSVPAAR